MLIIRRKAIFFLSLSLTLLLMLSGGYLYIQRLAKQVGHFKGIGKLSIMYSSKETEIYPEIKMSLDSKVTYGNIRIKGVGGQTHLEENELIYFPNKILEENRKYTGVISVILEDGKKIEQTFNFKTKSIPKDQVWVEVVLEDEKNRVYIRKGDSLIKEMPCSGGTKDEPTILGTYYLENRGTHFYSERFQEGALHWVRIKDQYLFHSVPRDKDGNIIPREQEKIGMEASHGCIRLFDEDARWFYDNVHDGTMVIIRK